ncbi:hypothetical protein HRE53_30145 (plasmid) [Acaryochloris sp. 'Moss Beach']|uniref:hypothetical protein n=1 Tax=Acaryochloris sp. 'Moss Beach' TaxID=2740837 RepID=UPI001F46652A|nr:hypothetical protein [Acaryochloris sp. 'Moss Beach']UJB72994.1 hypothetical protein HRE53_30145 [Acaryochloris sp. 'Moss Beach']
MHFLTYSQWLTNKRRDDSYRVAKDYIAALNENQEIIREINFHYSHLCPASGVSIESETIAKKRIEHLHVLQDNLSLARVHLSIANSELAFWKVKLSPSFSEQHNIVIKDLSNIVTIMVGLNSQLYLMFADDYENRKEVISHKKNI